MIDVYFVATPNGQKIPIALTEMGLDYRIIPYELFAGSHLTPEFRRVNPNNKLPAIVDHEPDGGGAPLAVFESGAILLYLAEKTGKLMPKSGRSRSLVQQWLIWQVAGLGPMHGQAHHFVRYAPEGQDYPVQRYLAEARRLLHVLNYRLTEAEYLAGNEYSIADIASWPWLQGVPLLNMSLDEFPSVARWHKLIAARPAVASVINSDVTGMPKKNAQIRAVLTPEEWSNFFGERMLKAAQTKP